MTLVITNTTQSLVKMSHFGSATTEAKLIVLTPPLWNVHCPFENKGIYTLFKHNSILDFHLRTLTSQEKSCVRIPFQTSIGITTGFALKRAICRELALWSIPALTFEILSWDKENNLPVPCIVKQRIQIDNYIISFPFHNTIWAAFQGGTFWCGGLVHFLNYFTKHWY